MAKIVVLGGGIGGVSAAYELREALPPEDEVTVVSKVPYFQFTPSNPWVAVKWRTKEQITVDLAEVLPRHKVKFVLGTAEKLVPEENRIALAGGSSVAYDYLVVATGPELAFDEIEGFGPGKNTSSVCDVEHAVAGAEKWEAFCADPGPIVVGAVQGASCFGPAYEFAMIMETDLRNRRIRDKVPMTFVTSEPYIGHLGLGGVGDTEGLVNPRGFILVDKHQRNPKYRNVFGVGVCIAIPPYEPTPVPVGVPKTGYMIESMVTATAQNVRDLVEGREPSAEATWNAICLADFGDTGVAFVAQPQTPPRNINWSAQGKWVHLAKVAFEKYFLRKVRKGATEPYYEKVVMQILNVGKLKERA